MSLSAQTEETVRPFAWHGQHFLPTAPFDTPQVHMISDTPSIFLSSFFVIYSFTHILCSVFRRVHKATAERDYYLHGRPSARNNAPLAAGIFTKFRTGDL